MASGYEALIAELKSKLKLLQARHDEVEQENADAAAAAATPAELPEEGDVDKS